VIPIPLALTNDQLDVVMTAAARLPPTWRGRFLAALADQLLTTDDPDDTAVRRACTTCPPASG
jgi:hypothetical protein